MDVHRAYSQAWTKPNTHVEVPLEDQLEGGKVYGCMVQAMYGTRQAASAWQEEVEKALRKGNTNPGASSPCFFIGVMWTGRASGLVRGDDFVIVTRRWHAKEVEKHLRSKFHVVRMLNRILTCGPNRIGHECIDIGHEEFDMQGSVSQHAREKT